jgi:glycosyltransferase involved in cell wall biosynthesis
MYHANLAGGLAAKLTGIGPVIWGIHASSLEKETTKATTRLVVWLSALLSGWMPDRIICCSQSSLQIHLSFGYEEEKLSVIPNGFNIDEFAPNPEAGRAIRAELGVPDDACIIGQVARFDPQKDFLNFIAAARQLLEHRPEAHFVLCGNGIDRDNTTLMQWIADAGIGHAVHLLGERSDVPRVCAAFDIACMSSAYGEAFPLAVGEAMASGVPAVVTNVGDTAFLVGTTGKVVAPRNPGALCRAWQSLLDLPPDERKALGAAARERIVTNFSIDSVTRRFEALYDDLVD